MYFKKQIVNGNKKKKRDSKKKRNRRKPRKPVKHRKWKKNRSFNTDPNRSIERCRSF